MAIINAKINDEILKKFRHVIYERHGLKKGDFKNALEEAMLDYIQKHSAFHGLTMPSSRDSKIA